MTVSIKTDINLLRQSNVLYETKPVVAPVTSITVNSEPEVQEVQERGRALTQKFLVGGKALQPVEIPDPFTNSFPEPEKSDATQRSASRQGNRLQIQAISNLLKSQLMYEIRRMDEITAPESLSAEELEKRREGPLRQLATQIQKIKQLGKPDSPDFSKLPPENQEELMSFVLKAARNINALSDKLFKDYWQLVRKQVPNGERLTPSELQSARNRLGMESENKILVEYNKEAEKELATLCEELAQDIYENRSPQLPRASRHLQPLEPLKTAETETSPLPILQKTQDTSSENKPQIQEIRALLKSEMNEIVQKSRMRGPQSESFDRHLIEKSKYPFREGLAKKIYSILTRRQSDPPDFPQVKQHLIFFVMEVEQSLKEIEDEALDEMWRLIVKYMPNYKELAQESYEKAWRSLGGETHTQIREKYENTFQEKLEEYYQHCSGQIYQRWTSFHGFFRARREVSQTQLDTRTKSFDELAPEIKHLIESYEKKRAGKSGKEAEAIDQELTDKIHQLIALPAGQRTELKLTYSDYSSATPYGYNGLDRIVGDYITELLKKITDNRYSQETTNAIEGIKRMRLEKLTFSDSLENTKALLANIEVLARELGVVPNVSRLLSALRNGALTIIEWLTAEPIRRSQLLQIPEEHRRGLEFFESITSSAVMSPRIISVSNLPSNSSADYYGRYINIDSRHLRTNGHESWAVAHELAHCGETTNRDLFRQSLAYRETRLIKVNGKEVIGEAEILKTDWTQYGGEAYSGKIYRNSEGKDISSEVCSTGVARMFRDPARFFKEDPGFFKFILDTLGNRQVKYPVLPEGTDIYIQTGFQNSGVQRLKKNYILVSKSQMPANVRQKEVIPKGAKVVKWNENIKKWEEVFSAEEDFILMENIRDLSGQTR